MSNQEIILTKGTDFTITALSVHLNSVYGAKKSGKPFSAIDVQKYVNRGHLPEYLGGNQLETMTDETIGLKIVRVLTKESNDNK